MENSVVCKTVAVHLEHMQILVHCGESRMQERNSLIFDMWMNVYGHINNYSEIEFSQKECLTVRDR